MTDKDFAGRTALITGATSGIGRATALLLAGRGAHVLVGGRDERRASDVVATIRSNGGTADPLLGELVSGESAQDLARRALGMVDKVDVLVNNAAAGAIGPTESFTDADLVRVFGVNVNVAHALIAALVPSMAARGRGAVVNVSSGAGQTGGPGMAIYGGSKAALDLMTQSWGAEYGPKGVRVNAVSPGPIKTPPVAGLNEDAQQRMGSRTQLGRLGRPEEVAEAIVFLASDAASYINGVVLKVDGGRVH